MDNKVFIESAINNLNDEGLRIIRNICDLMSKNELYDKRTTLERIEELHSIAIDGENQLRIQKANEQKMKYLEASQERKAKQDQLFKNLTGKEKRLFEKIRKVKIKSNHCMRLMELQLFANVYENNLIEGSYDIFRYGYLKGQNAEKAMNKKIS